MYTWMQPGISLISSFGPSTTPWRWWRVECHWRPWAIHVFLLFYGRFWYVDGWVRFMGLLFFCEFCDMFFHVVWICLWFIVFWNRTDAVLNWVAILKTLLFQLHVGPPWLKDLPILWKSSSEENMGSICENPMDIGDDTAIWLLKYVDSISIWLNMAIFYFMFPMSHFWSWWKEKGSLI